MMHRFRSYRRGVSRIFATVEKSPSFRAIVEPTATDKLRRVADETNASVRSQSYVELLTSEVSEIFIYDTYKSDIVLFGKTTNNLREFEFFINILNEKKVRFSHASFLQQFPRRRVCIPDNLKDAVLEVLDQAAVFARNANLTLAHFKQHQEYTKTYLGLLTSYMDAAGTLPKIAVVANDHSPAQVAFKAVMEHFRVPVIYVQHAEVTKVFPPLDFAASILRNDVSLDIYRQIGPIRGTTFVVSRTGGSQAFHKVHDTLQKTDVVGIYPTTRFNMPELKETARNLELNTDVSDYFVKPHPADIERISKEDQSLLRVCRTIPDVPHIALAGNSSVVTDLLARGNPVFQIYELDNIEPDYYGFVAAGLVPRISREDVRSGRFWQSESYGDDWLRIAARFEPAMVTDQSVLRQQIANFVRSLLEREWKRPSIRLKHALKVALIHTVRPIGRRYPRGVIQLAKLVASSAGATVVHANAEPPAKESGNRPAADVPGKPVTHTIDAGRAKPDTKSKTSKPLVDLKVPMADAVAVLMDQVKQPLYLADALLNANSSDDVREGFIAWFDAKWAERDQRPFDLIREQSQRVGARGDAWLRLKECELMATPLGRAEAAEIVNEIETIESRTLRRRYEQVLLRVLIRNGHFQLLFEVLSSSPVSKFSRLGANYKVEIARWLQREGQEQAQQHFNVSAFRKSLTEFEQLKIYAAGMTEVIKGKTYDHRALEEKFVAVVDTNLSVEFSRLVQPAYERLRDRMLYVDARTNPNHLNALADRIRESTKRRSPFSLVRLGDGEAYLFSRGDYPFTAADRAMRERHWWNVALDDNSRELLMQGSLRAVVESDVVGIPSIHRFFRDFSDRSKVLLDSTAQRGIVTTILGSEQTLSPNVKVTEDRIHHLLFTEGFIRELAAHAGRTVVVSSIKASLVRERFAGLSEQLIVVELPTHAKTKQNPLYVDWTQPLPFALPTLEKELEQLVEPGDLVLVSGGVAGKGLIGLSKRKGAIALDLGGQIETILGIPNGALF